MRCCRLRGRGPQIAAPGAGEAGLTDAGVAPQLAARAAESRGELAVCGYRAHPYQSVPAELPRGLPLPVVLTVLEAALRWPIGYRHPYRERSPVTVTLACCQGL